MSDEPPFTNREINRMFKEVQESLDRIEKQTVKTNGRVNMHDKFIWVTTGVISLMLIFGVPAVKWLFTSQLTSEVKTSDLVRSEVKAEIDSRVADISKNQ